MSDNNKTNKKEEKKLDYNLEALNKTSEVKNLREDIYYVLPMGDGGITLEHPVHGSVFVPSKQLIDTTQFNKSVLEQAQACGWCYNAKTLANIKGRNGTDEWIKNFGIDEHLILDISEGGGPLKKFKFSD